MPPLTLRIAPLTQLDSLLVRKRTAWATSSGRPMRFAGAIAERRATLASPASAAEPATGVEFLRRPGVSMGPGAMALLVSREAT